MSADYFLDSGERGFVQGDSLDRPQLVREEIKRMRAIRDLWPDTPRHPDKPRQEEDIIRSRWTPDKVEILRDYVKQGKTCDEISNLMEGFTSVAIAQARHKFGLSKKRKKK